MLFLPLGLGSGDLGMHYGVLPNVSFLRHLFHINKTFMYKNKGSV